jgi:hypothetical protein
MECLGRKSSILEVFTPRLRGRIYIEDGSIVHAEAGAMQGEVALYGLLALRGGEFNLLPFADPARRSIAGHYEFLLMEAARLRDEGTTLFIKEAKEAVPEEPPATVPKPETPAAPGEPSAPAERIAETLLCSGAGEVLYQKQCRELERRLGLLAQVEQQAADLGSILPAGRFERLEIHGAQNRVLCVIQPNLRLFVRTNRKGARRA